MSKKFCYKENRWNSISKRGITGVYFSIQPLPNDAKFTKALATASSLHNSLANKYSCGR
jgi:hypothetical protein